MHRTIPVLALAACLLPAPGSHAATPRADELAQLRQQIQALRTEYRQRIEALERRLERAEAQARQQAAAPSRPSTQQRANAFNPAISLILQGALNGYARPAGNYRLAGFPLTDEAGLAAEGLSLG